MAGAAAEGCACSWNKTLELKFYQDNVVQHGVVRARELSRANARSHRNEKTGTPTDWTVELTEDGEDMIMDDGSSLLEMATINPFTGPRAHLVTDSVRETAKVEGVTLRSAIKLAAGGEQQIMFPEHYLTPDGFVARYFTVWKQDEHNTRKYHGKRIDLGKNIPIDETRSMIRHHISSHELVLCHQDEHVKQAFVFSTKTQNSTDTIRHVPQLRIDSVIQDGVAMTRRIIRDTYETAGLVVTTIRQNSIDKKIQTNLKEQSDGTKKTIKNILDGTFGVTIFHALTEEPPVQPHEKRTLSQIWREIAQKTLHITAEEAKKLEHTVHTTWENMTKTQEQIALSVDTGIGIGGALFALESIVTMEFNNETEVFEDRLEKAAQEIIVEKSTIALLHVKPIEHLIDIVEQQSEKEPSLYTDEAIVLTWLKEFIPKLENKKSEEAITLIEEEQTAVGEKIQKIYTHIRSIVEVIRTPGLIKKEKLDVGNLSFALCVWMIVNNVSYYQRLKSVKKAIIAASATDVAASESHLSEAVVPQESTSSWLLFAIIWYLAMIREHGTINASGAKYQAKKKKKPVISNQILINIPMQQYAVIYPTIS
jgi:hypothetical protein